MKKYLLVIITLFCALTVSAVRYASPYTGSGRNYVHTTIHAATPSMAQAPVASMSSTSRGIGSRGASMPIETRTINVVPVSGIYTAATAVRGGVTTYSAGRPRGGGVRTVVHPGNPEDGECPGCVYGEDGICIICGHDVKDGVNGTGHCGGFCEDPEGDCGEGSECHCVPLTDGWQVWLMMALLAVAYAVRRNRKITQQAILAV